MMTQHDAQDKGHADGGDVSAETGQLSETEAQQMGAENGRGARQEQGAQASEEYVDEHISGTNDPAAKNSTTSRES
ncbi:hypothetical protein ACFFLM_24290 [Deinococcus oregonensis]|uniref:Uncharacterized protein n=1 Tax=Deinococcus oregonensis TaxID=1805970 RepID=A0ABV6B5M7_9DEIO